MRPAMLAGGGRDAKSGEHSSKNQHIRFTLDTDVVESLHFASAHCMTASQQ